MCVPNVIRLFNVVAPVPPSSTARVPVILDAPKSNANSVLSITAPPLDLRSNDKTADEASKPSPANNVAISSIVSLRDGSPLVPSSEKAIKSPLAILAVVNPCISNSRVPSTSRFPLITTLVLTPDESPNS